MKRHAFDPFSFIFGALFTAIGATLLFDGRGVTAVRPVRMWPATVVVVGLALVVWAVARLLRPEANISEHDALTSDDDGTEKTQPFPEMKSDAAATPAADERDVDS